jgi:hypothetical protein
MFLSYALVLFLAGLTSYVVSPVALKVAWIWDSDANVSTQLLYHDELRPQSTDYEADSSILFDWYKRCLHRLCALHKDCAPDICVKSGRLRTELIHWVVLEPRRWKLAQLRNGD